MTTTTAPIETLESIAARVSGLRAACSAEMTLIMAHASHIGDVSNSADAAYIYQLADVVLACNKLEALIREREKRTGRTNANS